MKPLSENDKIAIWAFVNRREFMGHRLTSWHVGGRWKLDGMWLGGNEIAWWKDGKIVTRDLGSKVADQIQRAVEQEEERSEYAYAQHLKHDDPNNHKSCRYCWDPTRIKSRRRY